MRLIDADALGIGYANPKVFKGEEYARGWNSVIEIINSAPTISPDEVRGVVHCKECKWCHAGYCEKHDDIIPWGCANKPWEDWFCADGAKMEVSEDA